MRNINVTIHHFNKGTSLKLVLPADTRIQDIQPLLYEANFVIPQKPGYGFLYMGHLCNKLRTIGDYIPEKARSIELNLLNVPAVLV